MKIKVKNALKTALLFILLLLTATVFALIAGGKTGVNVKTGGADNTANADSGNAYAYSNSSAVIDVDENKVLHVRETLKLGFVQSVSSISRSLSVTVNSSKNKNGKVVKGGKFLAQAENFKAKIDGAEAQTALKKSSSYYNFTITNPDGEFELWEQDENGRFYILQLEYDYVLSEDAAGKNALSFAFFGVTKPSWFYFNNDKTDIARLSVTVNMPKPFDVGLAGVYFGNDDITESTGLTQNGNSLIFSVSFKDIGENSFRVALPDGYFNTKAAYYPFYWCFAALVAVAIIISVILTVLYRGKKPVSPVEFAPPVVNPLHYSAYWHGYPQRKDVTTIILYWAQLGCIKIEKDGKKDLILTKLNPLPENAQFAERHYFAELFRYGDVFRSKDTRGFKNSARRDRIRLAVNALVEESEKPSPFVPQVERTKMFVNILAIIALTVMYAYFIILNADIISFTVIPLFLGFTLIPVIKLNSVFSGIKNLKQRNPARFGGISVTLLFALVPVGLFMWALFATLYMPQYDYLHMTLISIIWVLISFFVLPKFITRRTDEANALYGRMLGFKRFIRLADLPQMELLLKDNPNYFYDMLPYCMVMGLSKKIDGQMRYLNVAVPDWAVGFNPATFAEELFYSVKHAIIVRRKSHPRNSRALDA